MEHNWWEPGQGSCPSLYANSSFRLFSLSILFVLLASSLRMGVPTSRTDTACFTELFCFSPSAAYKLVSNSFRVQEAEGGNA